MDEQSLVTIARLTDEIDATYTKLGEEMRLRESQRKTYDTLVAAKNETIEALREKYASLLERHIQFLEYATGPDEEESV